jgi:hypothetical protein
MDQVQGERIDTASERPCRGRHGEGEGGRLAAADGEREVG